MISVILLLQAIAPDSVTNEQQVHVVERVIKLEMPLKVVEVNFSSKLQYTNNVVTVFEHNVIAREFESINQLYLYDEQGTLVTTFQENGKKDMHGYGE